MVSVSGEAYKAHTKPKKLTMANMKNICKDGIHAMVVAEYWDNNDDS
jgi:hypothetical protein